MEESYVKVTPSRIAFLGETPLYLKSKKGEFVKCDKAPTAMFIKQGGVEFFVRESDRELMLSELENNWRKKLRELYAEVDDENKKEKANEIKSVFKDAFREFVFSGAYSSDVARCLGMVNELVDNMSLDLGRAMVALAEKDYTTFSHSTKTFFIGVNYGCYNEWSKKDVALFGLCCLLHDMGKVKTPGEILKAPRRLTEEEFEIMKEHTSTGIELTSSIKKLSRRSKIMIRGCCAYHHEKLDSSGYHGLDERGVAEFFCNKLAQIGYHCSVDDDVARFPLILAIIDCFDALTTDDRPYRRAKSPLAACSIIKQDVVDGKYHRVYFEKFLASLLP